MPESIANLLATLLEAYALFGMLLAIAVLVRGIERVDRGIESASRGFRILVVPGVVVFWPLLLRRWIVGALPPVERNAHRDAAERAS